MENLLLIVGIAAGLLVVWWIFRKLFKLALIAGIIGVAAFIWFFVVR